MAYYSYTAIDMGGKKHKGTAEAPDLPGLTAMLHEAGLFLTDSREQSVRRKTAKLKPKQLADFNRELGSMLSSGITLARAISIMLRRDMKPEQKAIYEELYQALITGSAMSDACESLGRTFPPLLVNMYRAAEANGSMDKTCARMAEHYEKEYRLRGKLKSAATYPIILLALTLLIMIVIFTFVLPRFMDILEGSELPAITRAVLAVSDVFTKHYATLILVVAAVFGGFSVLMTMRPVRKAVDTLKLKIPLLRGVMRITYTARFSRTLSSLYASGLQIITALKISKDTVGNLYIADQFETLIRDVSNGTALSEALEKIDGYDKKLPSTVLIGEESGKLEEMLLSVSDSFDFEAEQATAKLASTMEPLMIIIMAMIVLVVILAVMLPIFNMYSTIGG